MPRNSFRRSHGIVLIEYTNQLRGEGRSGNTKPPRPELVVAGAMCTGVVSPASGGDRRSC